MICPGCHHTIENNTIVCPNCETYVLLARKNLQDCPYCREKIQIGADTCRHCKKDLSVEKKDWYQKKSVMIPLMIVELFLIWIVLMTLHDFTNIVQELEYRNNRLEILGKLAGSLDNINSVDSISQYSFIDKKINIEIFSYIYDRKTLESDIFQILKSLAPSMLKEMIRIEEINVTITTPVNGRLTSSNSIGDIGKINNGFFDKNKWSKNTKFTASDLF